MAHSATYPLTTAGTQARTAARTAVVPWYIWCCLGAVLCGAIGGEWDISWHKSIGRDSFWTPAHVLIYLNGVLAGVGCGYLILATTFRKDSPLHDASISMWGFRGPLGAFICAWGGVAMITSAPFDDWWHGAYGLDVKILSPPHMLLALGMLAIRFGTVVLIVAEMNRAGEAARAKLENILLFGFLFLLGMTVAVVEELTNRVLMHGGKFYVVIALAAPIWMAAASRVSKNRWAATIVTGWFTAIHLAFLWGLQLVPAEPKLGPVYHKITHLVPPDFPLLLIVGAIAFDLVRRRTADWSRWRQAMALGAAFLVAFLAAQWPFADFLMSPWSRNRIFATNQFPYMMRPEWAPVRNVFVPTEHTPGEFCMRMALALAVSMVMTRIGLSWGEWLKRVRR
jgi:hypothetical protein